MSEIEDESCDVLVAGSGAGGFATALTARLAGLDVLMVEKEALFGGTTAYSAGVIWIPGNHHQEGSTTADTPEAALAYLTHHVGNRLDRERAAAFVDTARWMLSVFEREGLVSFMPVPTWADYHPDEPGAAQGGRSLAPENFDGRRLGDWFPKLRPPLETMMVLGGMMVGRLDLPHVFRMTQSPRAALHVAGMVARHLRDRVRNARGTRLVNGNALIARMAYEAFRRDVRLWLQAPVVDLVRQGDRVCGAIVERNGARVRIAARRGVVLACGGFPGSEALTRQLYPHLIAGRNHQRLPPAGNTGDGLRLAQSVGGRLESDVHHPAAWAPVSLVPKEGGRTVPFPHFFERGKPGYIAVDRRGRRFVNEAQSYHVFVPAMIEACRGDSDVAAWIVCDHRAIRGFGLGALGPAPMRIAPHLASGYILRGATPAELAQKAGIDPAGLEATISTFNAGATHGEDREFGRGSDAYQRFNGAPGHQPNPCLAPLATPPYYAVRVVPGELGTFAGIGTDRHGRVLGQEKTPVAGLYAVGNDAVSVMGGTYPGAGITIGPAMTFGYIAARHIAEDVTA